MPVPILDLSEQHKSLMPQLREAFVDVIESGRLVLGHYVERFERELAQSVGVKHAVGVSSGTDGLALSFMALKLGPGDEVIVSPFTYLHTAEAITRVAQRRSSATSTRGPSTSIPRPWRAPSRRGRGRSWPSTFTGCPARCGGSTSSPSGTG